MSGLRTFVHVRTGPESLTARVAAWLAAAGVPVREPADAYAACLDLLRNYDDVPDLVALGLDWLTRDELPLVGYVRQTWPRAVILAYGGADAPLVEGWPLARVCRGAGELERVLAQPPGALVAELTATLPSVPLTRRPAPPAPPPAPAAARLDLSAVEPPRTLLTAEELAMLLDDTRAA